MGLMLMAWQGQGQQQWAFTFDDLALMAHVQGGPAPTITGPTNYAGCLLWHRSDLGVWSDDGSTAIAEGGAVYRWDDLSGNGRHSRQADSAARPEWVTNNVGTSGHMMPGIRMDGLGDCLTNIYEGTLALTVFIVASNIADEYSYPFMLEAGSKFDGEDYDGYWNFFGALPNWGFAYGGTLYEAPTLHPETPSKWAWTTTADDGVGMFTLSWDGATTPVVWKGENLAITNAPFVSTNYASMPTSPAMARRLTIGGYFHGQLTPSDHSAWAELIIFDRALLEDERRGVWGYLKKRYGL